MFVALAFALAAPVVAVLPHEGDAWLPLHVFLVGGLLSAISGASQLLAVTWSTAPAPPDALVATQRWLLAAGAALLSVVRAVDGPRALASLAGTAVLVALVLLAWLLIGIRRSGRLDRFHPAIDTYLVAIALGVLGTAAGVALVGAEPGRYEIGVRDSHLTVNLLGLVGLVILGTLPFFVATQARRKMSTRATPVAVRAITGAAALAVASAAIGHLAEADEVAAVALAAYGLVVAGSLALWPPLGRKQIAWAGPRLLQLIAGLAWWVVASFLFAAAAWRGDPTPRDAIVALVVGGYAQVLTGSLAYFGPVLRGGDHALLTSGFATTRSWAVLVAANVAALAAVLERWEVLALALAVWLADTAVRAAVLARPGVSTARPSSGDVAG